MNKKIIPLVTLIIFLIPILILLNNSVIPQKETSVYNIPKKLWKYRHNGGVMLQASASTFSYLGIAISSIFDEDIKNDMNAIDWNPFNTNATAVLLSKKTSFYKGVPVFRIGGNRAGSFLAIFLTDYERTNSIANLAAVRHEWGHNVQQMLLGPINYLLCIGLPSWQEWSNISYYTRPWEITADIFGEVTSRKHNSLDIERGYSYLDTSSNFGILSYLFLFGEY